MDAAEKLPAEDLLNSSVEKIVASLVAEFKIPTLVIGDRTVVARLDERPLETWGKRNDYGRVRDVRLTALRFRIPVEGGTDLLRKNASTFSMGGDLDFDCDFKTDHVVLKIESEALSTDVIDRKLKNTLLELNQRAQWANIDIEQSNRDLEERLRGIVERRTKIAREGATLVAGLDIPVFQTEAPDRIEVAPVRRKQLRPHTPNSASTDGDPRLAAEIYQDIVRTLEGMSKAMERTPTVSKLHEEEIRNLILVTLNANYEGQARGEVFNGAGKTDLLLTWRDRNVFIGECKFWTGPKGFTSAINQLLSYLVWRDTKAALIMFIRDQEASPAMSKAYDVAQKHPNFIKDETPADVDPGATTRRYVFHSTRDTHQNIHVALIFVILPASV
ncbi:hypothetical protein [Rhodococcus qingshengii]|uniref:hypothetical protein n=1 Tax=Rhodococcus qingshengii TaxID=334542 RepID=UPI00210DDD1D|nr:hypothetical protein [Rhodococcus qingshengii]MCQ4152012.1 hypothetical protein [Rhodococcus qingshengii]